MSLRTKLPLVEQGAAAAPYRDVLALLSGEDPESVMLHLMQPARPGGRIGDESWLTGLDETGRQVAPKTRRRGTPQHTRAYGWRPGCCDPRRALVGPGESWRRRAEGLCNALPEALDPLGQRLRAPAERRVYRRFVSAPCLVAGHDAFGQGVRVEVGAQARHSVGEPARVDADERALFRPGQLFLKALHLAIFRVPPERRRTLGDQGA
jgi:hypothetical protein